MFKRFLLCMAAAVALSACNKSQFKDGTYLIYQIEEHNDAFFNIDPLNDTINITLKNHFLNKRYQITFADKYATLHPLSGTTDIILAKEVNEGHITYTQTMDKGIGTMDYILDKDSDQSLLLNVRLHLDKYKPVMMPIQMPSNDTSKVHGNAVCHLSKVQ